MSEDRNMMVEMSVSSLSIDPVTKMPFLILKDRECRYSIPIWIGFFEAQAIALAMEGVRPERPMTHDLMENLLNGVGGRVDKIEIHDLKEGTFYASVFIKKKDGGTFVLDSRPSDSVALAVKFKAPIYVSEDVIKNARSIDLSKTKESGDKWSELLESLSADAFGKYKM